MLQTLQDRMTDRQAGHPAALVQLWRGEPKEAASKGQLACLWKALGFEGFWSWDAGWT